VREGTLNNVFIGIQILEMISAMRKLLEIDCVPAIENISFFLITISFPRGPI